MILTQIVLLLVVFSTEFLLSGAENPAYLSSADVELRSVLHNHFFDVITSLPLIAEEKRASGETAVASAPTPSYLSAGYVYVQMSNVKTDKACARTGVTVGVPVNTCITTDNSSYKVQLATDSCSGAVVEMYSDVTCTSLKSSVPLADYESVCNAYDGQRDLTSGSITVTVPLYFWQIKCTAQPSKPIPVASAVIEFYSDAGACQDYIGYASVSPDLCLPINNGLASAALKCTPAGAVNLVQYLGGTCGFALGSTPYAVDTCSAAASALPMRKRAVTSAATAAAAQPSALSPIDKNPQSVLPHVRAGSDGSDGSNREVDKRVLTELPVEAGTVASYIAFCGQPNTNIAAIVSVTQILSGVSYASFLASASAFTLALQKSIAASLTAAQVISAAGGVQVADVFISSVLPYTAPGSNRETHAGILHPITTSTSAGPRTTSSTTDALSVAYTVVSYRAALTNTKLAAALDSAVSSGQFTTLLRQWATAGGVPALAEATSDSLYVDTLGESGGIDDNNAGPPVDPANKKHDDKAGALRGAALIGVIVGAGALLVFICAMVGYFCFYRNSSAGQSDPQAERSASVPATTYGGVAHRPYSASGVPSAPPAAVEMEMEPVYTHEVQVEV